MERGHEENKCNITYFWENAVINKAREEFYVDLSLTIENSVKS